MEQIFRNQFSDLNKTWIFDLDGTLVKHNGYLNGEDVLLEGVKEFFSKNIKNEDYVLILTARKNEFKNKTENFLIQHNIKFNKIIFDLPYGERILFNDIKNSGLKTAYSFNLERNKGFLNIKINNIK